MSYYASLNSMNFPPPTPKQARVLWFSLTSLAIALVLCLAGLLAWGLGWVLHKLSSVLLPVAIALILAYILDPVVGFFERKRLPRVWAVTLVFALATLILAAALGSVVPGLRRESRKLINDLPKTSETVRVKVNAFLNDSALGRQLPASWRDSLQSVVTQTNAASNSITRTNTVDLPDETAQLKSDLDAPMTQQVLPGLTHALVFVAQWFSAQLSKISTWAQFFLGFILVPVYLFYFLLEKEAITRHWTDYLPLKPGRTKDEIIFVLGAINDCLIVFFRGQVLVALCVGALLAVGYLLMGLNYAVLLGLIAAVLGIVPYLGTITSLVLALAVAGVQFQDWTHPLLVLGVAALVKLFEDFIISPRIIGERAGLHPLTIILAVLIGTTVMGGILGAMLAIPLTAALRTLMFRYIWTREHPHARTGASRERFERTIR